MRSITLALALVAMPLLGACTVNNTPDKPDTTVVTQPAPATVVTPPPRTTVVTPAY